MMHHWKYFLANKGLGLTGKKALWKRQMSQLENL